MNDHDVKISFCIPVYNGEKYIRPCIESIINQEIDNYEIICVDDCSTDGSVEILTDFQQMHPQIRVLQNETNKGVSFSRNRAILAAKGKYIWFVDSDDLLAEKTANRFFELGDENDAEVLIGKCYHFHEDKIPNAIKQRSGKVDQIYFTDLQHFYQCDQDGSICFGIWLGIFRRSFLFENSLFFHEDLSLLEDVMFYFDVGLKVKKAFSVDSYSYYYRIRENSTIHGDRNILMKRYFEASYQLLKIISKQAAENTEKYGKTIEAHLNDRKVMAMNYLVHITDNKYVSTGMKKMEEYGLYPYNYDPETAFRKWSKKNQIIVSKIIPNRLLFWLLHCMVVIKEKIR